MNQPLVSILMPVYNRAAWLPMSIGSVLGQEFADWELLVIDDQSTDDTRPVTEEYAREDARIHYVENSHARGPSGARNQGLERAQGKFIAILDSDDEWKSHHLKEMVYYLEKYPQRIDLMTANPLRTSRLTASIDHAALDLTRWKYERLEQVYLLDRDQLFPMALQQRVITTQTIVARRELFARVTWHEDVRAGEDLLFALEVAHAKFRVGHLDSYHVTVWLHEDNTTNCSGVHEAERRIPVNLGFERYYQKILELFPLTPAQQAQVTTILAEHDVWMLGYNGYLQLGDFRRARQYMFKGIRLRPFHASYWKPYLATFIKQVLQRRQ